MTKAAEEFTTPVETDEEQTTKEPERISVDFDALRQQNGDVVAWLYGADTGLNYPVVQADDNDYYLYRLLDGSYNKNGTLFVDARVQGRLLRPQHDHPRPPHALGRDVRPPRGV